MAKGFITYIGVGEKNRGIEIKRPDSENMKKIMQRRQFIPKDTADEITSKNQKAAGESEEKLVANKSKAKVIDMNEGETTAEETALNNDLEFANDESADNEGDVDESQTKSKTAKGKSGK